MIIIFKLSSLSFIEISHLMNSILTSSFMSNLVIILRPAMPLSQQQTTLLTVILLLGLGMITLGIVITLTVTTIGRDKTTITRGKDDVVPTTIDNEEDPTSQSRSNTSSKVQALAQIVQESQGSAHRLKNQNLPGFVHLIS